MESTTPTLKTYPLPELLEMMPPRDEAGWTIELSKTAKTEWFCSLSNVHTQRLTSSHIGATPEEALTKMLHHLGVIWSQENCLEVANKIQTIQDVTNGGLGSSVADTILFYLRLGDGRLAKIVAQNDFDKLRQYPKMAEIIQELLISSMLYA